MRIVFDIGGTRLRAGRSPAPGRVEPLGEVPTPAGDFAAFRAAVAAFVPAGATGVAIALPGVADPATGIVTAANLPGLAGHAVGPVLARQLGCPVVVANDADAVALAEATEGAGRGHRVVFAIVLGTGVGGGLVIDGRLHRGAGGVAGEWGHGAPVAGLPLWPCGCGLHGCADTVGGARGLERLHHHLHGVAAAAPDILAAWRAGEAGADATVALWAESLAGPLALALNVTGASAVPVAGGLGRAAALVARLDAAVRARLLRDPGPGLLRPATGGAEPGLAAAAALAWAAWPGG
jgi:N-acetylglucosamine kinase